MSTAENKETLQLVNQLIDGLKNEYRLEEKDINELLSIEADLKSKEQSGGLTNEFLSENLEKLAIILNSNSNNKI